MATVVQQSAPGSDTSMLRRLRVSVWSALVLFTLIVATGAGVRLTGSGLGCSDWPNCSDQSLAPQHGHAFIEFGNRLITAPVGLSALACLFFAARLHPRRTDLLRLSQGLVGVVLAQILLGAVAVWTHLSWPSVIGHYMLSMASLVICVMLVWRVEWAGRGGTPPQAGPTGTTARALAAFGFLIASLGTFVTASGPNAGGEGTGDVVDRLSLFGGDTFTTMVMIHARVAAAFGIAAVVTWFVAKRRGERALLPSLTAVCVLVALAGLIGQLQYHVFDYPAVLVWLHVIAAALLWSACVWVWLAARTRS